MTDSQVTNSKTWTGLVGLGLVLMILNLDSTIINLALPAIGNHFNSSINDLIWINNSYTLALAATVMVISRVADNQGHRRMLMTGIWLFFLGSFLGGLAGSETMLIIARLIMGVGMAATFPMVFILALRLFPGDNQAFMVGLLITFTGVSQAMGPTLGGVIVEYWGWRYTFLINIPICVACFALIYNAVPADPKIQLKSPIHYPSALLIFMALFLAIAAVNQLNFWDKRLDVFLIFLSAIFFIVFFVWQHRLRFPLFSLSLFKSRTYNVVCATRSLFQINFGIIMFILPLYLQNVKDFSPVDTGLILLAMTAVLGVAAPLGGRFVGRYGLKLPLLVALFLGFLGFALLMLQSSQLHFGLLFISLFFIGIHIGSVLSITNYAVVAVLPKRKKGMGSGFFYMIAFFFLSFGVGMSGLLLDIVSLHFFNLSSISQSVNVAEIRAYLNASQPLSELQGHHSQAVIEQIYRAAEQGWNSVIVFCASLALLSFALGFLLHKPDPQNRGQIK